MLTPEEERSLRLLHARSKPHTQLRLVLSPPDLVDIPKPGHMDTKRPPRSLSPSRSHLLQVIPGLASMLGNRRVCTADFGDRDNDDGLGTA